MSSRPRLRSRVRDLPVVGAWAARRLDEARHRRKDPSPHLRRLLGDRPSLTVVHVGASDGVRQDPIRQLLLERPAWRALLIEPSPAMFALLRAAYPDEPRFSLVRAAVDAVDAERELWSIDGSAADELEWLPGHFDQLASFERQYLLDEMGPERATRVEPFLRSVPVRSARLRSLLDEHDLATVDLLVVDTNGHDLVVLRQLADVLPRPEVIVFEHKHLTASERAEAAALVADYAVTDLGDDSLCVRR